mmetsp:Transcript_12037/g.18554  ORF Transcript_12037/g.18554 Transcript_12037/m.18554 type:complete len:200 (-) Transcript_12037:769-1368(-)
MQEPLPPILIPFELHGWKPDPNLSDDENYIDLVLLLTRNSTCRQGHMACIIVRPQRENDSGILDRVIAAANNSSVYKERDSDNHAEINALGEAAKHGRSTLGASAVITMPPCRRCFGALLASGIMKIITTKEFLEPVSSAAKRENIEITVMDVKAAFQRTSQYISKPDRSQIDAERNIRKIEEKDRKMRRQLKLQELKL